MKTDRKNGRGSAAHLYRHPLLQSINCYVRPLAAIQDPSAARKVRWRPQAAAMAAVLMSLGQAESLGLRCEDALFCMAGDFTGQRRVGRTYNGLIKALLRQSEAVLPPLKAELRRRALGALASIGPTEGWTLMAVDGSRELLPRTVSNEQGFGLADNGKCPQAYTTAVMEVHTGLLWQWRNGRGDASERQHFMEMVAELPPKCLLLADGNFVGYRIWAELNRHDRSFLIRVGGNVHLLWKLWPEARIERRGDIVYAWPSQLQHRCPPLRLRLIRVGAPGGRVCLLTNVLDRKRLSKRSAGRIYRLRWGAELFFRTFKRTLGFSKLASRSSRRCQLELEWALISSCIMVLMGIDAASRRGIDPRRLSPAGLLRILRHNLLHATPRRSATALRRGLAQCLRDNYQRTRAKASRHRPITKNTPKAFQLKPPNIRKATQKERRLAHEQHLARAA